MTTHHGWSDPGWISRGCGKYHRDCPFRVQQNAPCQSTKASLVMFRFLTLHCNLIHYPYFSGATGSYHSLTLTSGENKTQNNFGYLYTAFIILCLFSVLFLYFMFFLMKWIYVIFHSRQIEEKFPSWLHRTCCDLSDLFTFQVYKTVFLIWHNYHQDCWDFFIRIVWLVDTLISRYVRLNCPTKSLQWGTSFQVIIL